MEIIGTLSSGISHDLNNVLGPIIMGIELLKNNTEDKNVLKMLDSIEVSAKRGGEMVKQILSFAKGISRGKMLLQPRHILTEVQSVITRTFPRNINIQTNIPRTLWNIEADGTSIYQVFLNLCVNARDAMPNGGKLTIKARNQELSEDKPGIRPSAKSGKYVVISIEDTGMGIPPELKDKIFEPFFTTKGEGKGTGLGLSIVKEIVEEHGGFIQCESEINKGTTFFVWLPSSEKESLVSEEKEKLPRIKGNGETILFVDDEVVIREITSTALETANYRVITAVDGIDAVSKYFKNQKEIRLIITDIQMPNMDGFMLIKTLHDINPQLPIAVVLGNLEAKEDIIKSGIKENNILLKPYTACQIIETVNEIISNKSE